MTLASLESERGGGGGLRHRHGRVTVDCFCRIDDLQNRYTGVIEEVVLHSSCTL